MSNVVDFKPTRPPGSSAYSRALARVGGMIEGSLNNALDEVRLTQQGIAPSAVDSLAQSLLTVSELNWVIARRTLSHRKSKGERLTPEETGRWLRAAKITALAEEVFGNPEKASLWLHKPRKAFNSQNALTLMQTEAGARLVEDTLNQLDAGYFA